MRQCVMKALEETEQGEAVRWDRVLEIRAAIKRGDYETPEQLEVVVDRLMDVLEG